MARWVALLRGVNVNGITVRSAELAQLFTDMGFSEVSTVLASGNVCFETETEAGQAELKAKIESGLRERFGYDAWIVLVQRRALAGIVENYPFALDEEHHAYVVFTSTEEARSDLLAAAPVGDEFSGEQVSGGEGVVYWRCPKGASTGTPFAKHVAKSRFRATTTNRNINTLRKML